MQDFRAHFQTLIGFQPRQFQEQVIESILNGQDALLRAPTGSGKTEAAIAPFLIAKMTGIPFPNKLIYVVPLRTLATSLRARVRKLVLQWEEQVQPERSLVVTLQTGENPEDPRFEGDIIFCTIDQLLSSFLNIPYSVGRGSANVNAGVVFASYLVFDELHLLDPDRSFATTLKLLEQVKGISPFLLMTATLTHELAAQIQQEITGPRHQQIERIEAVTLINVEGHDLRQIEGERQRCFYTSPQLLSATAVLKDIREHQRRRVIIICNTVAKSQGLFKALCDADEDKKELDITLLHSRFLPEDRIAKEASLKQVFRESWREDASERCQVLISTQVIEAGINITSEIMHVQLCPMNALLQRAGRCARFSGETGRIVVYRDVQVGERHETLAQAEDDEQSEAEADGRKRKRFLPYDDEVCELTWSVLQEHADSDQATQPVGFALEEDWINRVHWQEDHKQAQKRKHNRSEFRDRFNDAIFRGDRSAARDLIRLVDSRSIFVWKQPTFIDCDTPEVNIHRLQPFSLPITTICKIWRDFRDDLSLGNTWIFQRIENPSEDKAETYAGPVAVPVNSRRDLTESIRLLVNPSYVYYDSEVGLCIGADERGNFLSQVKPSSREFRAYSYHMDTYLGHLGRMWTCWRKDFSSEMEIDGQTTSVQLNCAEKELVAAGGKFLRQKLFPRASPELCQALFEYLVFLAVIAHDLGKLQVSWQAVMRGWQTIAFNDFQQTNPAEHLLAHTDYKPVQPKLKERYDSYMAQNKRPPHAVESAYLADELILEEALVPVLKDIFDADEEQVNRLCQALEMASGRHHSAWAKGYETGVGAAPIQLHPQAGKAISQSWRILARHLSTLLPIPQQISSSINTSHEIEPFKLNSFTHDQLEYQQLYWLVVRGLRLCDGRSVQLH